MSEGFSIADPIGAHDVADILSVSEARVRQMDSLLRPVTIRGRKIYSRDAVLRLAGERDARKGRA